MDFCEYLWDKFNTYETPDITEIQDLIKSELHIGLTRDDITEEYIMLQKLYKYLFSMYFIEKADLTLLIKEYIIKTTIWYLLMKWIFTRNTICWI